MRSPNDAIPRVIPCALAGTLIGARVALVQFSAQRDGSAFSGLHIADAMAASGWTVDIVFASQGPMLGEYRSHGHVVTVIPHKNWLRSGGIVRSLRNCILEAGSARPIEKYLRWRNISLVYVNTAASFAGARAAWRADLPCVWHLRELFNNAGGELSCPPAGRWLVRSVFRRYAAQLVANSRMVAQNLLGSLGSVEVVPNVVDARFFVENLTETRLKARSFYNLNPNFSIIGVPGTIRPVKGHRFLLESLDSLLTGDPNVTIMISGATDHEFGARVVKLSQSLNSRDRICFVGEQTDMVRFYCACDLVCVPSQSESFGRTVIEAMAVGVPVVATRVGGIPEILHDPQLGRLVDYGAQNKLRTLVKELLTHPKQMNMIASRARVEAEKRYRNDLIQQRIAKIIGRVSQTEPSR